MRIAYVVLGVERNNMLGGVGRKIRTQLGLWNEMGHLSRLFALVPEFAGPGVYAYGPRTKVLGAREATRAISRAWALLDLLRDVRKFQPDLIYLRSGAYVYPMHRLFRIASVILELNTNDLGETDLRGPYARAANRLTRNILLRNASGIITVTREIAALEQNRRFRRPIQVIGNGIDLRAYDPLPAPGNRFPEITLVGSPGQPWHGADKLLRLAPRLDELQFNVVGYGPGDFALSIPANVYLPGFLEERGVREVLARTDVACGSLALHRNRMQEGSSLKVREALTYGIPVLLGCPDTDLVDVHSDCILELPNTEGNVAENADLIRAFAYRMMGRRVPRNLVADRIDQAPKEKLRLEFFGQVCSLAGSARELTPDAAYRS